MVGSTETPLAECSERSHDPTGLKVSSWIDASGHRRVAEGFASRDAVIVWVVELDDDVYARLLALRVSLRRFEHWSAQQAQGAGLTPAQHQLLLAIRGHGDPRGPTIGELAEYLLLQHHSAVGLIDRAEAAGLIARKRAEEDRRVVRLTLTKAGAQLLHGLSAAHLEELTRLTPHLSGAWDPPLATRARADSVESGHGQAHQAGTVSPRRRKGTRPPP